jgi:hypothetical protein
MSRKLSPNDPCYWMLEQGREDPSKRTTSTVFKSGCFICEDEEFSLMGLPLCYPCEFCKGHVAADDDRCDDCGKTQPYKEYPE